MIYSNYNYTNNNYLPVLLDGFPLLHFLPSATPGSSSAPFNCLTSIYLLGLFFFVLVVFVEVLVVDAVFVSLLGLFCFRLVAAFLGGVLIFIVEFVFSSESVIVPAEASSIVLGCTDVACSSRDLDIELPLSVLLTATATILWHIKQYSPCQIVIVYEFKQQQCTYQ